MQLASNQKCKNIVFYIHKKCRISEAMIYRMYSGVAIYSIEQSIYRI